MLEFMVQALWFRFWGGGGRGERIKATVLSWVYRDYYKDPFLRSLLTRGKHLPVEGVWYSWRLNTVKVNRVDH